MKIKTPPQHELMTAVIANTEARWLMDYGDTQFYTTVAGVLQETEVTPYGDDSIRSLGNDTTIDNLLNLPEIELEEGEVALNFEELKSWIQHHQPFSSTPGTSRTTNRPGIP